MLRKRIVPCLLLADDGFYKTKKFKKKRYLGDPINIVKIFNDKCVDEIAIFGIDAFDKGINYTLIKEIVSESFVPVSYGGGINSINDAERLFALGVEKIILNSVLFENKGIIKDLVEKFGSQSIVANIEVKRTFLGKYRPVNLRKKRKQTIDIVTYIQELCDFGVGEIILNFVDLDGTKSGMNQQLIKELTQECRVPIVTVGGAKNYNDLKLALQNGASAVGAGAIFVYHGSLDAVLISYPSEIESDFIIGINDDSFL